MVSSGTIRKIVFVVKLDGLGDDSGRFGLRLDVFAPRLISPKYFSTHFFACTVSKSPATTSVTLLGTYHRR